MNSSIKLGLGIFGIVVISWLSYKLAFAKTWKTYKEYKNLTEQIVLAEQLPKQQQLLSLKKQHYDSIMHHLDIGNSAIHNKLLHVITTQAKEHKVAIMNFNEPHYHTQDEVQIYTFAFDIQGSFTNTLQLIYALEQKGNFGEIVHLNFYKKRDYKRKKNNLIAKVYLQHLQ